MLANFLLMPFFPSFHVVSVVTVVFFVAVADRTKQGNTPNDDNNVVVLALVFFLVYFCVASLVFLLLCALSSLCVACVATCSDIRNAISTPPLAHTPVHQLRNY